MTACTSDDKSPETGPVADRGEMTVEQVREIAKQAYVYGYPMVDNYRVQHAYFVDENSPQFVGPWNRLHSDARVYTPADTTIQTPNSDTPYSTVGADLRTEPLVLSVPPIEKERYFSIQFVDSYTYNFAYVGSRATGNGGGKFLPVGQRADGHNRKPAQEHLSKSTPRHHRSRIVVHTA